MQGFLVLGFFRAYKVPPAAERPGLQEWGWTRAQSWSLWRAPGGRASPLAACLLSGVQVTPLTFRSIRPTLPTFPVPEGPQTPKWNRPVYTVCGWCSGSIWGWALVSVARATAEWTELASWKMAWGAHQRFYKTETCVSIDAADETLEEPIKSMNFCWSHLSRLLYGQLSQQTFIPPSAASGAVRSRSWQTQCQVRFPVAVFWLQPHMGGGGGRGAGQGRALWEGGLCSGVSSRLWELHLHDLITFRRPIS